MGNCLGSNSDDDHHSLTRSNEDVVIDPYESDIRGGESSSAYRELIESGPFVGGHTDPRVRLRSDSRDPDKENEQIRLAKRLGLMQHLPQGVLDATTEVRECVICFNDLTEGQRVRYLPCMHLYHSECIDDWFQRSFTCPSCLEPVDAALLNTYNTT